MKINRPNHLNNLDPYKKVSSKKESSKETSSIKKDEVHISEEAQSLMKNAKVSEREDVKGNEQVERQQKIAELKRQIENGTYEINTQKLAEKIYNLLKDGKL